MIDRFSRDRLAEGIRHLVAGQTTNWQFEDYSEVPSEDPALKAVFYSGPWLLYDDWPQYRLRGRHRIESAGRHEIARWIMFLKTDLPYEWPVPQRGYLRQLAWILANVVTLGALTRRQHRFFAMAGDIQVWPFLRQSDYEAALTSPVYLGIPSNQTVDWDAPQTARPSP